MGFIRDETLGQTYSVVRHEGDSRFVRRWIPHYSPIVDIIPWDIVISQLSFPGSGDWNYRLGPSLS